MSAEDRQERRAQQLRRLQEINTRRREEKLQQDQERLERLLAVQVIVILNAYMFKVFQQNQNEIYVNVLYLPYDFFFFVMQPKCSKACCYFKSSHR